MLTLGTVFRPSLRGRGALELLVNPVDVAEMLPMVPCTGDRVPELPPSVAHLTLRTCCLDGLHPPAGRQLCSLSLEKVVREYRGFLSAQPINLLDWLEKVLPQAAVEVSDTQLTLGTLSMQRYARRLSAVAPCSIDIKHCTLHMRDGRPSKHSLADMARYLGLQSSRRVAVDCSVCEDSCRIVRVGRGVSTVCVSHS